MTEGTVSWTQAAEISSLLYDNEVQLLFFVFLLYGPNLSSQKPCEPKHIVKELPNWFYQVSNKIVM